MDSQPTPQTSFWNKIPSIVWVFIFVAGIAGFIGGIILLFTGIATVEGFGSLIVLLIALAVVYFSKPNPYAKTKLPGEQIGVAMIVFFFALMASVIDQTGNVIYNAPLNLACPENSSIKRETSITNPLPGRTDINQIFTCFDEDGKAVKSISPLYVMIFRFVEYVFFVYWVMYAIRVKNWLILSYKKI